MISLLVVNYRSAALATEAIRTARAASSTQLQVVVVDNSCDAREADALRDSADKLIVADTNRGYAGGINLGRRACDGEILIVTNPDVRFDVDAIDRLAAALNDAAVAGPALYWDDDYRWLLPPGDRYTASERVDAILASRAHSWFAERDRRRFRKRVAFWSLQRTTNVDVLSGAVMAIRADAFDDAEGFDERFGLYFEETDFLRRIAQQRERIAYVPVARCIHHHNQSASLIAEEAAAHYARSEMRYLEKWNGPFAARALKRLERPLPAQAAQRIDGPIHIDRDDLVVEASPLPSFDTAAGCFASRGAIDVPATAWTVPAIYLRTVVRRTGEVLATYVRYAT
ncbi:MAG TPA: glycosyltransferase [Thermoanaerobaculia bacterium]|nr:glycosyltransferase [Thermoanaerobaculia bacterium]